MTEATIVTYEQRRASEATATERTKQRRALSRFAALLLVGTTLFLVAWAARDSLMGLRTEPKELAVAWWMEGDAPVFIEAGGSSRRAVGSHRAITSIDTVVVEDGAQLHLQYTDGSVATVLGPSRFELREDQGRRDFRLLDGLVEFWVEPSPLGFYVATRLAMIRVIGTHFTVEHSDEADKTGLLVEEGVVQTWCRESSGGKLEVNAGDVAWIVSRGSIQSIQLFPGRLPPDAGEERKPAAPESIFVDSSPPQRDSAADDSKWDTGSSESPELRDASGDSPKPSPGRGLDMPVRRKPASGSTSGKPGN